MAWTGLAWAGQGWPELAWAVLGWPGRGGTRGHQRSHKDLRLRGVRAELGELEGPADWTLPMKDTIGTLISKAELGKNVNAMQRYQVMARMHVSALPCLRTKDQILVMNKRSKGYKAIMAKALAKKETTICCNLGSRHCRTRTQPASNEKHFKHCADNEEARSTAAGLMQQPIKATSVHC